MYRDWDMSSGAQRRELAIDINRSGVAAAALINMAARALKVGQYLVTVE